MNRYSRICADNIEYAAWLVADSIGGLKLVRGQPDTGRGEVAVALTIRVPLALFRKPLLRAGVTVPPRAGVSEAEGISAVFTAIDAGCDFEVEVSAKESDQS